MLKTKIGNLILPNCIYNASGVNCTEFGDLFDLDTSSSALVLSKSCTLESRIGNPIPRYYEDKDLTFSINSSGLPNIGYRKYIEIADCIKKDYFISVSALTKENNYKILEEINNCKDINGIELNLSCPNVIGKPQMGYDFNAMDDFLRHIFEKGLTTDKIFGLKLPPYFDISHFNKAADIINYYKIDFLTCINSIGNGLVINPENDTTVIKPKNGFGGIGGSCIKATALANVRQFYELTDCDIIGCGGIKTGRDAYEHILCGASAVQVGTQLYHEGVSVFDRLQKELVIEMATKKYKSIDEFKGKLNVL